LCKKTNFGLIQEKGFGGFQVACLSCTFGALLVMKNLIWLLWPVFFGMLSLKINAQDQGSVSDFTVRCDTQLVRFSSEKRWLAGRWVLPVPFSRPNAPLEVGLEIPLLDPDADVEWIPGNEYQVLDSLDYVTDQMLGMRIRVPDLYSTEMLPLNFRIVDKQGSEKKVSLWLYPFTRPQVQWKTAEDELFIGEEKSFELNGLHLNQIEGNNLWENAGPFDFRVRGNDDRLRLFILPLQIGQYDVKIPLKSRKWIPGPNNTMTQEAGVLQRRFQVKGGRLVFLPVDKNEIIAEEGIGQPIEIQLDKARFLPLKKTFRIESQQESGGRLIAEIFTRSLLANDKMLCWLRPYGYHRISEGYLYIKDGDEARYLTNFNLIEKAGIAKVSLLHEGQDWTENLQVFPGEKLDIRLEGNGLLRSRINLEGIEEWVRDSTVATDQVVVYHARIPKDFNQKKLAILLNKKTSGIELQMREYQVPRNLDFVSVDFGTGYKPIIQFNKPVLYDKTLQNIVLRFNSDQIETMNRFYGKQYLTVDINLFNNKKELMEYRHIENIVVCPGENSIRHRHYDIRDCQSADISLNALMARKTQDLPDWGRVEIVVKTNPLKYGQTGHMQRLEIYQQRKYSFDIDVSFPAGLIIKKVGSSGLGNLSGISTAIVGQFGFYRPDKIERQYPVKIGAGFIALDAFNFSENSNRDVGLVALGSVFPTKMSARFSFPLYLGFGYLLKDAKWFYILGPGIQVRF
jgi:hypothetical protein